MLSKMGGGKRGERRPVLAQGILRSAARAGRAATGGFVEQQDHAAPLLRMAALCRGPLRRQLQFWFL